MVNKLSVYECKCGRSVEDVPGKRIGCLNCNRTLIETVQGVISKGEEAPQTQEDKEPMTEIKKPSTRRFAHKRK